VDHIYYFLPIFASKYLVGDETIKIFDNTAMGVERDVAGFVPRTTSQLL
jgi:hypothetical protein